MAVLAVHSAPPRPGDRGPWLLGHAMRLLLDHVSAPRPGVAWRFGPLVVVSASARAAATAFRAEAIRRDYEPATATTAEWDGPDFDREIAAALDGDRLDRLAATLGARRLVVVDRIDHVNDPERQHALVHLLDASTAVGTTWCVSVACLAAADLGPQCASRLAGGLVVHAPPGPAQIPQGTVPSIGRVLRAAARHHEVPVEALLGPSRQRTIAAARSLAMYLARRLTHLSFHAIGRACGDRDHSTVLHGARVCAEWLDHDPAYAAEVERIAAALAAAPSGARCRSGVGSAAAGRTSASRRRR